MVRIKHRYLLVEILYPSNSTSLSSELLTGSTAAQTASESLDLPSSSLPLDTHLHIHAPTRDSLTPGALATLLRDEVAMMYGDWGVGKVFAAGGSGVSVKYLSPATSTAIIRCPRSAFRLVWAALTYLSLPPSPPAGASSRGGSNLKGSSRAVTRSVGRGVGVFRVLRVSGTMRKAEEGAIRRAKKEIAHMKKAVNLGLGLDLAACVEADGGASSADSRAGLAATSLDVVSGGDDMSEESFEGTGEEDMRG